MGTFNAITFNCNGLGNKSKRLKVFTYLKDKINNGFVFLQETHSVVNLEKEWKLQWGGEIHFSHGTTNSTGCAIAFSNNFPVKILNQAKDDNGRLLILEVSFNDEKFLLINLYNANNELDQLTVLDLLISKLDGLDFDVNCKPIFGGDFNLIFDSKLDASGGNPSLKKRSLAKLMKIMQNLDVTDIFRVRYPNLKRFTFHRKNPVIQRRLDYFFTSNSLQEYIGDVKVLPSFMSDHSPVFVSVNFLKNIARGRYGWKFNNSLLHDKNFQSEMKSHLLSLNADLDYLDNPHLKWEYLKYEARKFSIAFSKKKILEDSRLKAHHEEIISKYASTDNRPSDAEYADSKAYIESYFDNKTNGAILRSKSQFYEQNEKSTKYFLNLEKKRGENNMVKKLSKNNGDITGNKEILNELHEFYSTLFCRKISKSKAECLSFLNSLQIPCISDQHKIDCDRELTVEDLKNSLFSMSGGRSPGNDGLSVEFYKFFWTDIKDILFASVCHSRRVGELSTSQKQAIIKLLEKRDKDKRFIENWRPISLLNVDTKIISKSLASRFLPVLPTIISSDQTAYVKGRYIGESIRLISDILDISKMLDVSGYLLTVDLQKAFDSIDHIFLLACLEKFGFGTNFIAWIRILLNNNESCVSNGGRTTQYFKLNRGARQGDPIAAYLFIIVLEIFFIMIRSNKSIKPLRILDFEYLLSAYADDTTFFVSDLDSINAIFATFDKFSLFSGMKINMSKCELAGIGVKRSVLTALSGVRNILLLNDCIRVLGVNFTYDSKLFHEKNYIACIKKLQKVLHVWGMRFLTLYGKIIIFKSLAFSKIIYIASMASVPADIIKMLENIHKDFVWDKKRPNIKHLALISNYPCGGLKDIDIPSKFKSLHLNWLNRLFDNNFHPWKQIPLFYFKRVSKKFDLFHPNLSVPPNMLNSIPTFYCNIIKCWQDISFSSPINAAMVFSESICFNSFIKIDNTPISPSFFGDIDQIYLSHLFTDNGVFISWAEASRLLKLRNYFKWIQIVNAIPIQWKNLVKNSTVDRDACSLEQHLVRRDKMFPIKMIDTKFLYNIFIDKISTTPTSQKYFDRLFGPDLKWEKIYTLPHLVTVDTNARFFQFKLSHNTLFLNSRLFHLNYSASSLCSLCQSVNETPIHFFCECRVTVDLWNELTSFFAPSIMLDPLTPKSAMLGFLEENNDTFLLKNHILLLFKSCVYKNRTDTPNIHTIIRKIKATYEIEKNLYSNRFEKFENKWSKVTHLLE